MNDNELDAALSRSEEIVPSSGFMSAVMDAVHQEAAMPPPIPFPWRRAVPGLVACLSLVAFLIHRSLHSLSRAPSGDSFSSSTTQLLSAVSIDLQRDTAYGSLKWFAAALLITLVALWISMRYAD